ncbi:heterokaryon incompatibility, partial [Halenospora varia]
ALSYTWGKSTRLYRIIVDGHNFDVTYNLFKALGDYAVDAICLDQLNLRERAEQVLRMRQIYETAMVYVHLDIEVEVTVTAVNALHSIAKNRFGKLDPAVSPESWLSVCEVFSQPWFIRVWVIQEFVVAQCLVLFLG